jgi:hypothetical protein
MIVPYYIPLEAATLEINTINPIILIEKASMEQAVAGSEFSLGISLRNISNNPGFDLALSFKVEGTDGLAPFSLVSGQSTAIEKIEGNEARTVLLRFSVDSAAQNKDYKLVVSLTGKNALMQEVVNSVTVITVPVTFDITKPVLLVTWIGINPEYPDPAGEFDVNIKVENLSKTTDARNIVMLLEGADNFEVREISNKKNIDKLGKGEEKIVTYRLRAKDTRSDNTIKLTMEFDYLGSESSKAEETLNLPLPWEEVGIGATPWVIVKKYTLSAEKVLAGNTVNLKLFIENTNQRPVKNVKISLGVITIEETSSTTGTRTTTGGTVFSPVNSSNSFYLDSIPGKTTVEKDIDLYVDPNAAAKTYIVPVEIKYEDRKGKTLECEELVNIPVTQECKLNVLSVQVPSQGFVGQPIQLQAEFVNVGKVALSNFMVNLEGDFSKENGTYYVGSLDIGVNDFFQGTIIPQAEGKLEGMLVFSYIDNNNKDVRVEKPFSIEIQDRPVLQPGMNGEAAKPGITGTRTGTQVKVGTPQKGGILAFLRTHWFNILLVLFILLETVYIWRLKKKKTGEEFFDEQV